MPAIAFTFDFDDIVFETLDDAMQRAPKIIQATVEGPILRRLDETLLERLQTEPGPPRYPLKWRSEKQRRFVMAKLRRENNLPYQRTGDLVAGWSIEAEFTPDGGGVTLNHTWDKVGFVVDGPITDTSVKQPMFPHWYDVNALVAEAQGAAEDDLAQAWFAVLDTPGGFE